MTYEIFIKPMIDNKYQIAQDIIYKDIVVPKGYETDGISIPRIFWSFIPPFKPKYLPAVIIHDYLCDKEEYKLADTYFEEILYSIEKSIKTKIMVISVKLYHKFKYRV